VILDYAQHPTIRGQTYRFPRRQMQLTVPNGRRNSVIIVPGGGPVSPKGGAPLDRDVNVISYQFRIMPDSDRQSFDAQRDEFLRNIDHGVPQTLAFLGDDGRHWFVPAILLGDPLEISAGSNAYADFRVEWAALRDLPESAATGAPVWGHNAKWGRHAKWGSGGILYPLTANPAAPIVADNTANGATASTTDAVLRITGPYGPASPSATNFIAVTCAPSGTVMTIQTNLPTAADVLDIDLAARRVLRNGQPAFGILGKPAGQRAYVELLPGVVNTIVVSFAGAPVATPNGKLRLNWKPKRGF
jgi:hypothetical protein